MSKRLLVLLTGLLLLSALVSYVYYRRDVAQTPVDLWALVPDDAVFVVTTRDHPTLVRHLKEVQLWDNLATLRYFQQVEEYVTLADSLGNVQNSIVDFLGTKTVLTSVHVTGSKSFDLLFVVPVASVREHRHGDDLRKVHWRATARSGELMVRLEERPWRAQATLLLDTRTRAHLGTGPCG